MENDLDRNIIKLIQENTGSFIAGSMAAAKIKAFLKENGCSRKYIDIFFSHPDKTLGSFDSLPADVQDELARAAHFHIQEMNLLTNLLAQSFAYGYIQKMGGYLVHLGWKLRGTQSDHINSTLVRIGRKIIRQGRDVSRTFIRYLRFTRFYHAPFIHMLWMYAKADPWPLIQNYIKRTPVDSRLSPVFKCADQGAASCGLIGIDLLPSRGKLYFIESNFNPGHNITRHLISPEGDILCHRLTDWAAKNGYTRIVFFPFNYPGIFEKKLEDAWRSIALKKGINIEIVDDPTIGSPWPRSRRVLMNCNSPGTLYVNGRHLVSPLSRVISEKGLLDEEIRRFNEHVHVEERIPIPQVIRNEEDIPPVADDTEFPNIIIKNARLDETKGVYLYKSKHLPAGANSWPNIAYEYIIPDLVVKEDQGVMKRYVYLFRVYLLITPDGPVYLCARKGISSVPVPKTMPFGMVEDKSPYITNYHAGAYYVTHSDDEEQACRKAALSIGAVIFRFLKEKHILTVD